jgi:hypothetical protein
LDLTFDLRSRGNTESNVKSTTLVKTRQLCDDAAASRATCRR